MVKFAFMERAIIEENLNISKIIRIENNLIRGSNVGIE